MPTTASSGTLLTLGSHTLNVTFTPTDSTDYTMATASATIVVTQGTPVISWGTPAAVVYGTQLSGVQLNATVTSTTLVPLSSYYNVWGIITDGSTVQNGGFDGGGNDYSGNQLGTSISWNGVTYPMGPVNAADAVRNITINLPQGQFATLNMLGALVNNATASNTFTVTYTDGTTTNFTQSLSDWVYPMNYAGESNLKCNIARDESGGAQDTHSTCVYGYQFPLNTSKIVQSVTLPNTNNVVMLAMGLTTPPIPGTMVYTPAAGTVPDVGTDTLSVTFTPTDTLDYSSASASVQLVVKPALAYINWPPPAAITYGTPLSATQLDASALTAPTLHLFPSPPPIGPARSLPTESAIRSAVLTTMETRSPPINSERRSPITELTSILDHRAFLTRSRAQPFRFLRETLRPYRSSERPLTARSRTRLLPSTTQTAPPRSYTKASATGRHPVASLVRRSSRQRPSETHPADLK